jgi:hypothetical protein
MFVGIPGLNPGQIILCSSFFFAPILFSFFAYKKSSINTAYESGEIRPGGEMNHTHSAFTKHLDVVGIPGSNLGQVMESVSRNFSYQFLCLFLQQNL